MILTSAGNYNNLQLNMSFQYLLIYINCGLTDLYKVPNTIPRLLWLWNILTHLFKPTYVHFQLVKATIGTLTI